ncbi:MAG TPA: hypothetical protein VGL86_31500, partial [Polyangia bacterium]
DNSGSGFVTGSSGGGAHLTLVDCRAEGNGIGIRAIAGGVIDVYDSDASHNATAGVSADLDGSGGASEINLESVDASENGVGVQANAAAGSAIVRLSKVLGTANVTAPVLAVGNGELLSFGNNRLDVVAAIALASTAPMATVDAGAAATYPISVDVTGLLPAPISFACSNLPPGASCAFSPATLTGITTGATTLRVTTTSPEGPDAGFVLPRLPPVAPLLLLLLLGALAMMMKRPSTRRPLGAALATIAFVGAVAGVAACGSSAKGNGQDLAMPGNGDMSPDDMSATGDDMSVGDMGTSDMTLPYTATPPGTYNITVTATAGTLTATLPLTLVVQ